MKKKSPGRWLLLIPIQALAAICFTALGAFLDSRIFSNPGPEVHGHGMPIFTVLFLIIALVVSLIVLIIALVGFFHALVKADQDRNNREN